jgi:Flp pilus assembly protein TadG
VSGATRARTGERGQATFLGVGLAVALLAVGGLSVDLWRVLIARRALAEAADAAAAAGANAVDAAHYRRTGEIRLEPDGATALAAETLAAAGPALVELAPSARVDADTASVFVAVEGEVRLTLLRLVSTDPTITVSVRARAVPVRGP